MAPIDLPFIMLASLFLAALCAFVLRLLDKWKVIQWYQMYRPRWMPADCTLCFSWWFGLLACILWYFLVCADLQLIACLPVIPVFTIYLLKR